MNWRIILAVGIALAMLPTTAMASHMGQYRNNPLEHDLYGTLLEPDGVSTSVLGPTVTNCVIDLPPFDGKCIPDPVPKPSGAIGDVLAPGCTGGANERRVQGQCGLWTIGAGATAGGAGVIPPPVSELGMPGDAAPGAYTPTKSSTIRLLDGRIKTTIQPPAGGTVVVDHNYKLRELERLTGLDLVVTESVLPVQNYVRPWYGEWTDRNGNGVIDHATPGTTGPTENEFTWLGSCIRFGDPIGPRWQPSIDKGLCKEEGNVNLVPPGAPCEDTTSLVGCTGSTLHTWFFPGNHHATGPANDNPGNQPINWAVFCGLDGACADQIDQDGAGDSILGAQNNVTEDLASHERTGDPDDTAREWGGGNGWTVYFYGDDGLLVTMVEVYGTNCGPVTPAHPAAPRFALVGANGCTFTDVDRQTTINPDVEALLVGSPTEPTGGLKGTARTAWLVVRDGAEVKIDHITRKVDSIQNSRDVYVLTQGATQGNVDDGLLARGFSREPNHPGDLFVGARYGSCSALPVGHALNPTAAVDFAELEAQHAGFCNTQLGGGIAYDSYRGAIGRGFIDAQPTRHVAYSTPVSLVPGMPCQYCLSGSLVQFPLGDVEPSQFPPTTNGDVPPKFLVKHERTLGPGMYTFGGLMGIWRDTPHVLDESLFPDPPMTTLETYPADGWIGIVQSDGGQWRYRGYLATACTTEKGTGVFEAAECNPFLDGNVENPHNFAQGVEGLDEFDGSCAATNLAITLEAADGSLDTQIIVWRAYNSGISPDPLDIDNNGDTGDIVLDIFNAGFAGQVRLGGGCDDNGFRTNDYMIWAEGNRGDDIITRITHPVSLKVDTDGNGAIDFDTVTDVDRYAEWEPL